MTMRKPLFLILLMMATACAVGAQEANGTDNSGRNSGTTAEAFASSPVAKVNLSAAADQMTTGRMTLATAAPAEADASVAAPDPAATPAADPKYVFGARDDYRWQLGLGVEFLRFQSNFLNASLVGVNTTVTYYTNDWFAVEGNLVTGFAPTIYEREHVKYFGGGGGLRIGTRKARFEPWGHVLIGGGHLQPQISGKSKGALTVQAGIGLDYRVNARFSLRGETDYEYSGFYNQTQNNFQAVAALVFHF